MEFRDAYKVVIIGTAGVGKTSLLLRFVYNEYLERIKRQVCEERKVISVGGKSVELELCDVAGERQRFGPCVLPHKHLVEQLVKLVCSTNYDALGASGVRMGIC